MKKRERGHSGKHFWKGATQDCEKIMKNDFKRYPYVGVATCICNTHGQRR
jgi:hypothetical protein